MWKQKQLRMFQSRHNISSFIYYISLLVDDDCALPFYAVTGISNEVDYWHLLSMDMVLKQADINSCEFSQA